jgi:hypothetical protein
MSNLVEILAETLISLEAVPPERSPLDQGNLQHDYLYFLSLCNGGYTPDCFFHFFGTTGPSAHNLRDWNAAVLWKSYYSLTDSEFVFAEDVFGTQFFFDVRGTRKVVKTLAPDTGKVSLCSNTLEDFLEEEVFGDELNLESKKLAKRFFESEGALYEPFTHISCRTPVVFGGSQTDLKNLELVESLENIRLLGQIVNQIKNLPPGTRIDRINLKGEP